MARKPVKTLDEQLIDAKEELRIAEEKVVSCKNKIKDIEHQIEDKFMLDAYQILKQNNLSLDQLQSLIQNKDNKQPAKKTA